MKALSRVFVTTALLTTCAIVLTGCDGGISQDDVRIGPSSLSGTTLTFTNTGLAAMTFIASRGQTGTTETGAIIDYTPGAGTLISFRNPTTGAISNARFPDDFTSGSYLFTPIGESSGTIAIWGVSSISGQNPPTNLFAGALTAANPVILNVLFDTAGTGTIQNLEIQMDTVAAGTIFLNGADSADLTLTAGGAVPAGYDSDPEGFSEFSDGLLDGVNMILNEDGGNSRNILFASTGFSGGNTGIGGNSNQDNPVREVGTALLIESATNERFESVAYETRQRRGTDEVSLSLNFSSGTGEFLPPPITYVLTYESLDLGSYIASDGSTGRFQTVN